MKKTVLTYGLISGAILVASLLISGLVFFKKGNLDYSGYYGYGTMVLAFLFIYFGMVSYRDNVMDGRIRYGRAFVVGLLITLVAGICYALTWAILSHYVFPDFPDKYAAYTIGKMRQEHKPEAEIAQQITAMQQYKEMAKNPVMNFLVTLLIEPLPVGILVSLLSALIVRLKSREATL